MHAMKHKHITHFVQQFNAKNARHVLIGGGVEDYSEPQNNDVLNIERDSPAPAVAVAAAVVVDAVATLPVQQLEQEEDPPEKLLFGSTTT